MSTRRGVRRREFITLVGGAAVAWPMTARGQQADKVYRIGVFSSINPIMGPAYRAFLDELRVQGFIQGQNLVVDLRSTDQSPAAIAGNVAEMVRSKVDAIFAGIQPALQSAAGTGIPVIIAAVNFDPIALIPSMHFDMPRATCIASSVVKSLVTCRCRIPASLNW